jgi:hypothetical protein
VPDERHVTEVEGPPTDDGPDSGRGDGASPTGRILLVLAIIGVVIAGVALLRDAVVDGVRPAVPEVAPSPAQRPATVYSRDPDGAKSALLTFLDHRAAGEYDGVWDMYTEPVHKVISKEDFVKLEKECPTGRMYSVVSARMESDDRAVVEALYRSEKISIIMSYVDTQWRVKPTSDQMSTWSKGLEGAISDLRLAYRC